MLGDAGRCRRTPKSVGAQLRGLRGHRAALGIQGCLRSRAGPWVLGFEESSSSLAFTRQREPKRAIAFCSFMREVSLHISVKESSKKIMHVAKSQPGEQLEEK